MVFEYRRKEGHFLRGAVTLMQRCGNACCLSAGCCSQTSRSLAVLACFGSLLLYLLPCCFSVVAPMQAISRCHFEETDPESDELVLMKVTN